MFTLSILETCDRVLFDIPVSAIRKQHRHVISKMLLQ